MAVFQSAGSDGTAFAENEIGKAVEDVVLVGDVVVEGHRLDLEFLSEPTHRERLDPGHVDKSDGSTKHPFPAQRGSGLLSRIGSQRHLHSIQNWP